VTLLEDGNFQNILRKVRPGDMDANQKCGVIVTAPFGSLVTLRDQLERDYPGFVYCTISSMPLYIVHWNDLAEKKQKEIEGRKER
jgi:hypothetical protein